MEIIDRESVMESMTIICDTREQPTGKSEQRYRSFGVPYNRAKLNYGDYTYNATLPDGKTLYDMGKPISPCISIERKESLDELAQCFTRGRDRFEREFQRAKENNARILLLVENATWENLLNGKYRSKFNSNAFLASLAAWIIRYDLQLIFCKAEISGILIKEFLYRDLKDRLEKGEFDER